jgi:hypothetical protein
MSRTVHRIYVGIFVLIVILVFAYLVVDGASYYGTSLEERFYHSDHTSLKPSGDVGHGLGIFGTLSMILGVGLYMTRKRMKRFRNLGILKHWLEFHIFLCTLGPIMVLFHTAFKFGGIVSISFWSMVGVAVSGVIGRFIYIQIPRSIEGRELSLSEVREMRQNISTVLRDDFGFANEDLAAILEAASSETDPGRSGWVMSMIRKATLDRQTIRRLKSVIRRQGLSRIQQKHLVRMVRDELTLGNRIGRLQKMQQLFRYWHVAHLPFALIMLIIMVVHVAVTLTFGYKWIF